MTLDGQVIIHRLDPDVVVSVEAAKEVERLTGELADGARVATVVDMRGMGFAGRDAREVFAHMGGVEAATALLVRSDLSAGMAGLFKTFQSPDRPVQIFTEEQEAVDWARRQVGG